MSESEQKSSAKAKAEARRQRILAASGERMGVVSGGTEGASTADGADTSAVGSPEGGMSKYAAARRRRYGKKKAAVASSEGSDDKPAEAAAAEAAEAAAAPEAESTVANEEPAASAPTPTPDETGEQTGDKKKYMGVAKMRRKRLAEKKKKEEEEAAAAANASTSADSSRKLTKSVSSVARDAVKKHRFAIFMQLFTLVLLFLAGLGVGMQNHALNDGEVAVSRELSLNEHGFGALRILGLGGSGSSEPEKSKEGAAASDTRERLLQEETKDTISEKTEEETVSEDEFGDAATATATKPKGVDDDTSEPNIDPLFRVDLDQLTAGPGVLKVASRVAVKLHRSIMYLVLVLPVAILQSILALPRALMTNPPILFILTVVIRYLGRDILGAQLPDLSATGGGDEEGKDMMSSAKNMAMNFLTASFPNAAKLMEIMRDARQDMFVILCGLFVGLVLPIHLGTESGKDEL